MSLMRWALTAHSPPLSQFSLTPELTSRQGSAGGYASLWSTHSGSDRVCRAGGMFAMLLSIQGLVVGCHQPYQHMLLINVPQIRPELTTLHMAHHFCSSCKHDAV